MDQRMKSPRYAHSYPIIQGNGDVDDWLSCGLCFTADLSGDWFRTGC